MSEQKHQFWNWIGGEKTKGKQLTILLVALLATILLTTTCAGVVTAKKTTLPYQDTQSQTELAGTVEEKWSQDGHVCIRTGNQRVGAYNGPLGVGTFYSTNIISMNFLEIPPSTPFTFGIGTVMNGFGIYNVTIVIESGPYGAGTIQGSNHIYWDMNLTGPRLSWYYDIWGTLNLQGGTGGLKGIKIDAATTQNALRALPMVFNGELTLPED